jgi:hypothetical protein
MNLNAFAAEKRMALYEDLRKGLPPHEGEYSDALFKEGKVKGQPQMGTTRYEPHALVFEFIYPDPQTSATVLSVRLVSPERIVFLPVPDWVVETIWQGDIDGSFHFETEALELVAGLQAEMGTDANLKWFGKREPKRRE